MFKLNALVDSILRNAELNAYSCHPLSGNYKGFMDCHIESDWILVYKIEPSILWLHRTGTHSDLF